MRDEDPERRQGPWFLIGGKFGGMKLSFEVYFHNKNMSLIYG